MTETAGKHFPCIRRYFLLAALAGVATLWMAIIADVGASLLVTLNGMRLLKQK